MQWTIPLVLALMGAGSVDEAYERREMEVADANGAKETVAYRLMSPLKVETGQTYPLVLFLHGAGERGTDNGIQLKYFPKVMASPEMREKYPAFVLAPQCRSEGKWVEVDWAEKKSASFSETPGRDMRASLEILDNVIKSQPVDTRRIYVTGLSMGGYGTWDVIARRPKFFAAAAPICGGGDESQAAKLVGLPIYAYHGDQDGAVPVERTRRMIEAIRAAGGSPKYKELPGVGHYSWDAAYSDADGVIPWMFAQRKSD